MNQQENDKWLDDLISGTINTAKPEFDAEKWKQRYPKEFGALKSRARRTPSVVRPNIWSKAAQRTIAKLAAAAVIILTIGISLVYRGPGETPRLGGMAPAVKSPAKMMTMIALANAYRRGGVDAVNEQFDRALEILGPRLARVSMDELFEDSNG
ncbi:MAG: hypothetical protein JSU70_01450 [Phycisphaerales bacterium]|nr:MAG: hypothetical protein JSU70_01450 [Phycisphaerales bacterium]